MARYTRDPIPLLVEERLLDSISQLLIEFHDQDSKQIYQFILECDLTEDHPTAKEVRSLLSFIHENVKSEVQQSFTSEDLRSRVFVLNSFNVWQSAFSSIESREKEGITVRRSNNGLPPSVSELIIQRNDFREAFFVSQEKADIMQDLWRRAAPQAQSVAFGNSNRHVLKVRLTPQNYEELCRIACLLDSS